MTVQFPNNTHIPSFTWWDTDGTKVNSEPVHEIRWENVAKMYGVRLTPDMFDITHRFPVPDDNGNLTEIERPLRGAHESVICHWIINKMREQGKKKFPSLESMRVHLMQEYRKNAHLIQPREGIPDLLETLRNDGHFQATVTGCHREIAQINLSSMGTIPLTCLGFVVTADNTTKQKPHEAPYLFAFQRAAGIFQERLGRPVSVAMVASKSAIVEDSPTGVESGLRTGAPVIQFLNPGQKPFPAQEKGFDPSKLFIAHTAQDIYKHRVAICQQQNHHAVTQPKRCNRWHAPRSSIEALFCER